jgi:hypothetical protein
VERLYKTKLSREMNVKKGPRRHIGTRLFALTLELSLERDVGLAETQDLDLD